MSSPVPVLRAPQPGAKGRGGLRLGLAIPPSPNQKPVGADADVTQPILPAPSLPPRGAPKLTLATPMGTQGNPLESVKPSKPQLNLSMVGGTNDNGSRPRSDSCTNPSMPASASSSTYSNLSFIGGQNQKSGTPDPTSAISLYSTDGNSQSMERADSQGALAIDFDKLSLELGHDVDLEDMTEQMWEAASEQKRIIVQGELGEGAGGAVTKCVLQGGKTVFALKIITANPDPTVRRQILREMKFNEQCDSDYICKYYSAFRDRSSSTISIVMEFCEGGSLDSVYREVKRLGGRTGEKPLAKIAEGTLHGLTYLNDKKIMHRDIKPSNILLCRNGQVKLCDFGVSGEFGTKGDANTFIGTSYYMAPERIQGLNYTITSDVWSLGVTLLEVAQHRFPFPADGTDDQPRAGMIDLLTYIVSQPVPTLKDEPDGNPPIKWSDGFKYFIECCLEKQPGRRATPWRMLEHPWMAEMKTKKVNMAAFLAHVWDWPV